MHNIRKANEKCECLSSEDNLRNSEPERKREDLVTEEKKCIKEKEKEKESRSKSKSKSKIYKKFNNHNKVSTIIYSDALLNERSNGSSLIGLNNLEENTEKEGKGERETDTEEEYGDENEKRDKQKRCNCSHLNNEELQILLNKLKEVAYWDELINTIKKKKKKELHNKIKLHSELMESNFGNRQLKEIENLKNQKMNEQLAVLARAQYILENFEKKINVNAKIQEDNINVLLISLENFKKHIKHTYLNKSVKNKCDNCVSL